MSTIINLATPGIGNRIKTYVSCMSEYETVKTCNWNDSYIFRGVQYIEDGDLEKYETIDGWILKVIPEEIDYIDEYTTIDHLYEKTPQYFIDKYLPLFKKLDINPEILEYVNDFTKDWDDMVGVHIRSWYCQRNKWHDNSIFENEIDKLDQNKKIFFCSDNSDVQKYFIEKYGDRIITYEREIYNHPHKAESGHNKDLQANVDAFIEMLLLSRCSTIIGTYISTFTECAWWFGDCKPNVIIPIPLNAPQKIHEETFLRKVK